jgi:pimeloyl-ACP methyl ester carboxylesterase
MYPKIDAFTSTLHDGVKSMQTLQLPDGELLYQVKGVGPSLLLLHAGVADSRMWDPQFEPLSEHFRVARCDLRGYGRSLLPDAPFAYHDDIRSLVQGLHLAPIWIVGASFGARVAVDFTLAHPDLVKGLILVSPVVSGFQPGGEVRQFGEEEDALLNAGRVEEATELNLRMWVDGPQRDPDRVSPAIREQVGEMQLQAFTMPEPENVSWKRLDPPALARLADIHQPTLIVSGALDVPSFLQLAEHLAEEIPQAQRVVLPEVAHMLTMEIPEDFTELMMAFIQ